MTLQAVHNSFLVNQSDVSFNTRLVHNHLTNLEDQTSLPTTITFLIYNSTLIQCIYWQYRQFYFNISCFLFFLPPQQYIVFSYYSCNNTQYITIRTKQDKHDVPCILLFAYFLLFHASTPLSIFFNHMTNY